MAHGTIYLVQPLFGCSRLIGEAVIGPTWVEYTFAPGTLPQRRETRQRHDDARSGCAAAAGAERESVDVEASHHEHRVLIPLTNVMAISLGDDLEDDT